jgi:GT2 family glycosyltransferase
MPTIAVSILNYQASEATIACVQSLLAAEAGEGDGFQLQIYVADNASDAADRQRFRDGLAGLERVHQRFHDTNLGFAAGHNQNLARILDDSTPDFVWLLNNDCQVAPQSIRELLACAGNRPEVAIWGGTLLEPDGETIQCAGGCFYSSWLSSYRQHGRGTRLEHLDRLGSVDFDYLAGASLFMPGSTLVSGLDPPERLSGTQKFPWLNEEFFLFFEELDLVARLKPGLQIAWCRKALITHSGGAGTDSHRGSRSPGGEYHSTLSALMYTRLYHPNRLWVMAPARLIAKILINLAAWRMDLLKALFSAYRDFRAWLNNPA